MQPKRFAKIVAGVVAVVAVGVTTTSAATLNEQRAKPKSASCGTFTLGVMAPVTGSAASIGLDQLHWPLFFVNQWNKNPKARFKLRVVQGDDQLDPSKAAVVAQQFASTKSVVGMIGPPGSSEAVAIAPILIKAGLSFVSPSATRVSLTNGAWRGYFYRVVPNDGEQGPTDVDYMTKKLGVRSGTSVMIVDDQESYSTGLADIVQQLLTAKGVKVDRESINQNETDFSPLVAKITSNTKVVYTPFQLAAQTQLFAQQLKAQGKSAIVFGTDGSFDSSKFTVNGSYISFFAPDVATVPADAKTVAQFHKQYPGATSPFGAPAYVGAQVYATAISSLCAKHKKVTRASLRAAVAKVHLKSTLLGPIAFTRNGDVARAKFHIFKIENGKYITVQ